MDDNDRQLMQALQDYFGNRYVHLDDDELLDKIVKVIVEHKPEEDVRSGISGN